MVGAFVDEVPEPQLQLPHHFRGQPEGFHQGLMTSRVPPRRRSRLLERRFPNRFRIRRLTRIQGIHQAEFHARQDDGDGDGDGFCCHDREDSGVDPARWWCQNRCRIRHRSAQDRSIRSQGPD